MRDTAEELERSEATLHDSAERSPDPATAHRLHTLGDEVSREASEIEERAEAIEPPVSAVPEQR